MSNQNNSAYEELNHNFDPINAQIELELEKQREKLRYESASRWKHFAIAFGITIIAIAAAYALYGLAEHFLKQPVQQASAVTGISNNLPDSVSATTDSNVTVSVDFTVFRTAATPDGRSVVTGYKYSPEKVDFPYQQYCYISQAVTEGRSLKIDVGSAQGADYPVWNDTLDASDAELARSLCVFISP